MPRFAVEIVKRKTRQPEPSFRELLIRTLDAGLTKDTAFLFSARDHAQVSGHTAISAGGLTGAPDLVLIHRGRAFGLDLKSPNASLSGKQRAVQLTLRDAGMRVEVARDLDEALTHVRDMGIPLGACALRRAHRA